MHFVVPTFHPAYIGRNNRRFEGAVLKIDFVRALGTANGTWKPTWDRSKYTIGPSFKTALKILNRMAKAKKRVSYDIETDGRHPLVCAVRCLAFYDGQSAICIPFLYRDGTRKTVSEGPIKTCTNTNCQHGPGGTPVTNTSYRYFGPRGDLEDPDEAGDDPKNYQPQCWRCRLPSLKTWPVSTTGPLKTKANWVPWWTPSQRKDIGDACQRIFSSCPLDTQNGQYDRLCLEAREKFEIPSANKNNNFDCILAHHIVASYFPHNLNFLACVYTEAPYYKTTDEGDAWSASTDEELWIYNCDDVQAQYTAATKLREEVRERPEDIVIYEHDSWYEEQGQRWKRVGVQVDWRAVELFRMEYGTKQAKALAGMRKVLQQQFEGNANAKAEGFLTELLGKLEAKAEKASDPTDADTVEGIDPYGQEVTFFNPASLAQLRLLLRHLNVPLTEQTATGDLSTAKDFLLQARKELKEQGLPPTAPALMFLDYLFAWREAAKLKGTYLYPVVLPDGRVHPSFSFHIVPSGRLSSQGPNFQNQPAEIRGIFVAKPKHKLVTGDWDAGEMRLSAFSSGDKALLKTFEEYDAGRGPKPHIVNASILFGLPCNKELPDKYPGCYRAAKVFVYLLAYGGGPATCYDKMRDEMPDLSWEVFLDCFNRYKQAHVELFAHQSEVVSLGSQQHYLESPVMKRRVYFFEPAFNEDGPEASVMKNMGPQSGLADIVGAANRRLDTRCVVPWRASKLAADESLEQLAQVHDELLYEVPSRLATDFKGQFKTICEEPVTPKFTSWRMPVDVKVREPLKPWAPSRWKDIHVSATCCGKSALVEYAKNGCRANETVWEGLCENPKCKQHGKKFTLKVAHGPVEMNRD